MVISMDIKMKFSKERGDYVVQYKVIGYSNDYYRTSLNHARAIAIAESLKRTEIHTDSYGNRNVLGSTHTYIDEVAFYKGKGYLHQVGNAKQAGFVKFVENPHGAEYAFRGLKIRGRWLWRASNKTESVWLDKDGRGTARLTKAERDKYIW